MELFTDKDDKVGLGTIMHLAFQLYSLQALGLFIRNIADLESEGYEFGEKNVVEGDWRQVGLHNFEVRQHRQICGQQRGKYAQKAHTHLLQLKVAVEHEVEGKRRTECAGLNWQVFRILQFQPT